MKKLFKIIVWVVCIYAILLILTYFTASERKWEKLRKIEESKRAEVQEVQKKEIKLREERLAIYKKIKSNQKEITALLYGYAQDYKKEVTEIGRSRVYNISQNCLKNREVTKWHGLIKSITTNRGGREGLILDGVRVVIIMNYSKYDFSITLYTDIGINSNFADILRTARDGQIVEFSGIITKPDNSERWTEEGAVNNPYCDMKLKNISLIKRKQ